MKRTIRAGLDVVGREGGRERERPTFKRSSGATAVRLLYMGVKISRREWLDGRSLSMCLYDTRV
jgi:hypothetical protein